MDRSLLWLRVVAALLLPACSGGGDDDAAGDGDADVDADGDTDGDGDADDNACALEGEAGEVALHVQVDGLEVLTCVSGRWKLNVRICGEAADPGCALLTGGPCSEDVQARLVGDVCERPVVTVPTAGHYTMCVEAELVNGFYAVEDCMEIDVPAQGLSERVEFAIDTDDTFPCVRDWWYDPHENQCCTRNAEGGFCAPVDY